METKPKYTYLRHLGGFNIYMDDGNGSSTRIERVATEEDARRRVCELNGWKYKPKNPR